MLIVVPFSQSLTYRRLFLKAHHSHYTFEVRRAMLTQLAHEFFWIAVYIFATRHLLHTIQREPFRRLRQKFNGLRCEVPSRLLLEQLFEPDCDSCGVDREQPFLKNYFLEHIAFWLVKTSKTDQRAPWERLLEYFRYEDSD